MFRRSASLAIPHHKRFAAILSVSVVLLGHMNRNVFSVHTHRSVKLPLCRHFEDRFPDYQQGEVRETNGPLFRKVCVFDVERAIGIARFKSVSDRSRIARHNATKALPKCCNFQDKEHQQKSQKFCKELVPFNLSLLFAHDLFLPFFFFFFSLSISLSLYIYIYISFFFLSLSLSLSLAVAPSSPLGTSKMC